MGGAGVCIKVNFCLLEVCGKKKVTTVFTSNSKFILLEVTPKARQPLLSCLLSRSHVHTSGTKPAICGFFSFLTVDPPKIFSRSFAKKLSWRKQRKGEWPVTARDVTNRGGVWGGHPPPFARTTSTSKSPSEAVFILLEVTPKARQPLFFWRLLLKPGSPYCSPVSLSRCISLTLSRAYKWN